MKSFNFSDFKYWPQLAAISLLLGGILSYRYFAYYDTRSKDAYVSAHVFNMESLVSGPISQVFVKDNQFVKKGEKLLQIDPRPFQNALKIAKSNYESPTLNEQEKAAAEAELDKANYLLEMTTIKAPTDGYITNFTLVPGQYISEEKALFALIDTSRWWVVSRYRETALRLIKPGDKADVELDMYPGKIFHGHVESIGWGINRSQSGNVVPSALVYMDATEDWINIAQRFPVLITLDDVEDAYPMRVGASASTITYR